MLKKEKTNWSCVTGHKQNQIVLKKNYLTLKHYEYNIHCLWHTFCVKFLPWNVSKIAERETSAKHILFLYITSLPITHYRDSSNCDSTLIHRFLDFFFPLGHIGTLILVRGWRRKAVKRSLWVLWKLWLYLATKTVAIISTRNCY